MRVRASRYANSTQSCGFCQLFALRPGQAGEMGAGGGAKIAAGRFLRHIVVYRLVLQLSTARNPSMLAPTADISDTPIADTPDERPARMMDEMPVSQQVEDRRSAERADEDRRRRRRAGGEEEVISDWMSERLDAEQPVAAPEGLRATSYRFSKRALDIVGSLGLMLALSPVLVVTFLILLVTTKGRPLFIQRRIGYLGRRFPMIKFRTMRLDADKIQHQVCNEHETGPIFKNRRDPRITAIGRFLRKTSIDEMPQLFNVLMGHMSLVGPRPPVENEVVRYKVWQSRRLAIKPGLTCLWQVSGRSEIPFDEWVRMDIWYAQNQTFWTDLCLLAKTPWVVITGRGAY